MKTATAHRFMRRIAAWGLFVCAILALLPLGCGGVEHAPPAHSSTEGPRLPGMTQERLRACVKEYSDQFEQAPYGIQGTVTVDEKGRVRGVAIEGTPESAHDFGSCVRVTLREMAVPDWMLPMLLAQEMHPINERTGPLRNELANPVVAGWALLLLLAELAIEVEGIEVVFAVSLQMVAATAEVIETLRRRSEKERNCDKGRRECLMSHLAGQEGDINGSSRCLWCYRACMSTPKGVWPNEVERTDGTWASCRYW